MRLIIIGLTLALAGSAPLAATAQAPVTTQPLARGEVLLEVNALGVVTTRADRATLSFNITGSGEDEAAARTDAERNVREIRALLRGQGIAEADISVQPVAAYSYGMGEMGDMNMAMAEVTNDMDSNASMPAPQASANAQTEVVIRNIDHVQAVQSALMERGIFAVAGATYALNDEASPRRQARAQALQKARADAESYAASLNMRVVRVVRVTERIGLDLLGMMASESQAITSLFSPPAMRAHGPDVPTMVVVGVDYALAPR